MRCLLERMRGRTRIYILPTAIPLNWARSYSGNSLFVLTAAPSRSSSAGRIFHTVSLDVVAGGSRLCARSCGHLQGRTVAPQASKDRASDESSCLGPCALANVASLMFDGRSMWLHSVNTPQHVRLIFDYVEMIVGADLFLPHQRSWQPTPSISTTGTRVGSLNVRCELVTGSASRTL